MINTLGPSESGTLWVFNTIPSPLLLETLSDALTSQGPALLLLGYPLFLPLSLLLQLCFSTLWGQSNPSPLL